MGDDSFFRQRVTRSASEGKKPAPVKKPAPAPVRTWQEESVGPLPDTELRDLIHKLVRQAIDEVLPVAFERNPADFELRKELVTTRAQRDLAKIDGTQPKRIDVPITKLEIMMREALLNQLLPATQKYRRPERRRWWQRLQQTRVPLTPDAGRGSSFGG